MCECVCVSFQAMTLSAVSFRGWGRELNHRKWHSNLEYMFRSLAPTHLLIQKFSEKSLIDAKNGPELSWQRLLAAVSSSIPCMCIKYDLYIVNLSIAKEKKELRELYDVISNYCPLNVVQCLRNIVHRHIVHLRLKEGVYKTTLNFYVYVFLMSL